MKYHESITYGFSKKVCQTHKCNIHRYISSHFRLDSIRWVVRTKWEAKIESVLRSQCSTFTFFIKRLVLQYSTVSTSLSIDSVYSSSSNELAVKFHEIIGLSHCGLNRLIRPLNPSLRHRIGSLRHVNPLRGNHWIHWNLRTERRLRLSL